MQITTMDDLRKHIESYQRERYGKPVSQADADVEVLRQALRKMSDEAINTDSRAYNEAKLKSYLEQEQEASRNAKIEAALVEAERQQFVNPSLEKKLDFIEQIRQEAVKQAVAAVKDEVFDFSDALYFLKHESVKVARQGWNGKGMFLTYIDEWGAGVTNPADFTGTSVSPFIAMKTEDNKLVPWLASQTDLLAVDWVIVE